MYTEVKSYQIIISLLKKYGIKNLVLSAGSRNVPFVHSVEKDPFFKCYSVVDERSAGYFALGLSQELNEPVVISCTSSTATCNYWPPVAEAFYQNVPLIILTSDRNPAMLGQWEDQMIDQVGMFDRHVKKSVNLPIIHDDDDIIFCQRLVNEAFLELNHNGKGPVHINVPTKSYNNSFNIKKLPEVTKIDRISYDDEQGWIEKVHKLEKAKRILITCGQLSKPSKQLVKNIEAFFHKYNVAVSVEHMSNIQFEEALNLSICMDSRYITDKNFSELIPDIVISFGGNIFSGLKEQLRKNNNHFEHWLIQENGQVIDMYKSLTTIFECKAETFFEKCSVLTNSTNNKLYYEALNNYKNSIIYPEFPYSSIYAIKNVVENIKENSILHLSVNNSIRIANFFKLNNNVMTYANIGTYGIDGCMSTFFGQSVSTNKDSYLIIGDLAFFYDMNSLKIKHIKNNVHILLINNHGGSEFYFNRTYVDKYSDLHTTARHNTKAEGWAKDNDFIYISANDKNSFDTHLSKFLATNDKPILFEIFTEMEKDAKNIYNFFNISRPKTLKSEIIKNGRNLVKKTIGQEKARKILNTFKRH